MKAISLYQPWATMIALGLKQFETRSWATNHRGPLAIQAAQRWTKEQQAFTFELFDHPVIGMVLRAAGYTLPRDLPLGRIVCTTKLNRVLGTEFALATHQVGEIERLLGDYSAGRFAWLLLGVKQIEPIPCVGRQGIFDWQPPAGVIASPDEATR